MVGVNVAAGYTVLKAYESKDLWNNSNPHGLTYQHMLGGYVDLMMESTRKKDCMDFIKANYPDWQFNDYSSQVIRR